MSPPVSKASPSFVQAAIGNPSVAVRAGQSRCSAGRRVAGQLAAGNGTSRSCRGSPSSRRTFPALIGDRWLSPQRHADLLSCRTERRRASTASRHRPARLPHAGTATRVRIRVSARGDRWPMAYHGQREQQLERDDAERGQPPERYDSDRYGQHQPPDQVQPPAHPSSTPPAPQCAGNSRWTVRRSGLAAWSPSAHVTQCALLAPQVH
jgi:hypothetical protein